MAGETDATACEICKVNQARIKECRDFRRLKLKLKGEFLVCDRCSDLNNFWFLRMLKSEDKRRTICELLEGSWESWVEHPKKRS